MPKTKQKVSLLINIISPARLVLYSGLAKHFDLQILHGGTESNRDSWNDLDKAVPCAQTTRAWGWQVEIPRKNEGKPFDRRYIHITPGYIQHLLTFRPDALITNEMGLRTLLALIYGTLFRKPVWVWWGGTPYTEREAGFVRRIIRAVISRWACHWISYGQTSTEYLRSLGVRRDRILEIQNAVDESLFAAHVKPEFDIQPRPVLLCAGRLVMRKGVEQLLNAAAAVQKEGFDFSLVLVGSGPDKLALEQLATAIELKNLHVFPMQKPEKMPAVYRSANVLVFPTLEDVWGLVANEATLCGLTVLCSKYAGCAPELFPPRNIFDPKDAEEFRRKLRQAVNDQLAAPDCSRLRTTPQLLADLIRALEISMRRSVKALRGAAARGVYEP
ncbi:MAG: glycosyltransferase family 4 protein [Candidatus Acidiferrales bacterium]